MGWRFDVWSHPSAGAFEPRIAKLPITGASVSPRNSQRGDGRLTLPPRYPRDAAAATAQGEGGHLGLILIRNPNDPTQDRRSVVRIYRDGATLPTQELVPMDVPDVMDPAAPVEVLLEPLTTAALRDAIVWAYDWPIFKFPDWIWGGPNLLQNPGFEEGVPRPGIFTVVIAGATGGTWTATYNAQTTAAIAWNAPAEGASSVKAALEALSTVDVAVVSGTGSASSPYRIEIQAPPGQFSLSVNGASLTPAGATATPGVIQLGAVSTPTAWTKSMLGPAFTVEHGCHALDSVRLDSATPDTGTYSMYYNADCLHGGIQQVVDVEPGWVLSGMSIRVRPLSSAELWAFVLRDVNEGLVSPYRDSSSFTNGVYSTQTIAGLIQVPDGVTQVVFRHAWDGGGTGSAVTVDNATLYLGLPAATWGDIVTQLMDDCVLNHVADGREVLAWLDYSSFDAANDSNGDAWVQKGAVSNLLSFTVTRGWSMFQVLEAGKLQFGYEWRITPKVTPPGGFAPGALTHDLRLYNPRIGTAGGQGSDRRDDPDVAYFVGRQGVTAGPLSFRALQGNAVMAEGADGLNARSEDASSITAAGRIEYYLPDGNITGQETLQAAADQNLEELLRQGIGIQLVIPEGVEAPLPGLDVELGDTVRVSSPPFLDREPHRLDAFSWDFPEGTSRVLATAYYSAEVLYGQEAVNQGVVRLLERAAVLPPPEAKKASPITPRGGGKGMPTVVVAASDATALSKEKADLVCTGNNDQVTIRLAQTMASAWGRVQLTEGTFYCVADVNPMVSLDNTIEGMGTLATYIIITGGAASGAGFRLNDQSTLKNLWVEYAGTVSTFRAVYYAGAGVEVYNCKIDIGLGGSGIFADAGFGQGWIHNCAIYNGGIGIDLNAGTDVHISGCWIEVGDHCIRDVAFSDNLVVEGCYLNSDNASIEITDANRVRIIGNWIISNLDDAVDVNGTGNGVISANHIGNCGDCGVDIHNCVDIWKVSGNRMRGLGLHGVRIDACDNVTVVDNTIYEPAQHGVLIADSDDCIVADNFIFGAGGAADNTYDGIHLSGDSNRNSVQGNRIRSSAVATQNTRWGVNVSAATCDLNVVNANVIGPAADFQSGVFNDAGTGTQGTNFTV